MSCSAAAADEARVQKEMQGFEQELGGKAVAVNVRDAFTSALTVEQPLARADAAAADSDALAGVAASVQDASIFVTPANAKPLDRVEAAPTVVNEFPSAGMSFADSDASADSDDG